MHSVARLAYHGWIDNIQASWVKMGIEGARTLLRSGANDLGGTLMEENISRAAGASHGQLLDLEGFKEIVNPLGRRLAQRSTLYKEIAQFS
jgi:FO synthase